MRKIQFSYIASGDHGSFCFDVSKETFSVITKREPEESDKSVFNKGLYRIYPNEFFKSRSKGIVAMIIEEKENGN